MDDKVFWTSASRDHDWTDFAFPQHMVDVAASSAITGDLEWVEPGANAKRRKVDVPAREVGNRLARLTRGKRSVWLTAGGSRPQEWTLHLHIAPFDTEDCVVSGINFVEINACQQTFLGEDASARLWAAFRKTHDPNTTEYAGIDLSKRWNELVNSAYDPPLETVTRFKGVLWANFLGKRQLSRFDRTALQAIEAFHVEWVDDDGLFLQASPDVGGPEVDKELIRLTNYLRAAEIS